MVGAGEQVWSIFLSTSNTSLWLIEAITGKAPATQQSPIEIHIAVPFGLCAPCLNHTQGVASLLLLHFMAWGHVERAALSGKEPGLLCVFFPLHLLTAMARPRTYSPLRTLAHQDELGAAEQVRELETLPLPGPCGSVLGDSGHLALPPLPCQ